MNGDDTAFDIASTQTDGVSVVRVTGEIDIANADAMQAEVTRAATQTVVLDLTDVTFLDSSGIRAIDRARRGASLRGEVPARRLAARHPVGVDAPRRRVRRGARGRERGRRPHDRIVAAAAPVRTVVTGSHAGRGRRPVECV
jgi:hypothetical protein